MKSAYQPDVYNTVIIFTDGKNQNPYGGLRLQDLVQKLKADHDPTSPVSVVIGAYGPDIDTTPLKQITSATRGKVYLSLDPHQAQRIFLDMLLHMFCDPTSCPINT